MKRHAIAWAAVGLASMFGISACQTADAGPPTAAREPVNGAAAGAKLPSGSAHPHTFVGVYLSQATNFRDSEGDPEGFPAELDEAATLHADGTYSTWFFTQNFSAFPVVGSNGVGGTGTWRSLGNHKLKFTFFRWIFFPKETLTTGTTAPTLNQQIPLGYVRGVMTGTTDKDAVFHGTLLFQTISTSAPVCASIGKSAPCVLRPTVGEVMKTDVTSTPFDPTEGPDVTGFFPGPFPDP